MRHFLAASALAIVVGFSPKVSAAGGPMTLAEQKIEAKRLSDLCNRDPNVVRWKNAAQGGGQAALYEASAAMIQCFYNNVDSRYPADQKREWLTKIQENKQAAAALR